MTAFVNDDGEYLDYTGPDVGITKQAANFFDFKIKGDISATLKIDNNSQNRKALGYYGAQQIESPAFSKVAFNMVKDGNIISRGFVVINDSDEKSISCFYISGNTNWFQNFQFNLKSMDFEDHYTILASDIDTRKAATDGIIFPLVDWWGDGKLRSSARFLSFISAFSGERYPTDVQPCIYLHTIVDAISRYSGVGISGDLITDALFKKIIITPDGPEQFIPDEIIDRSFVTLGISTGTVNYNDALDPQPIQLITVLDSGAAGQYSISDYSFTAPYTGTYKLTVHLSFSPVTNYDMTIYVNGALYASTPTISTETYDSIYYVNIRKGEKVIAYIDRITGSGSYRLNATQLDRTNFDFRLEKVSGHRPSGGSGDRISYILPQQIVPDMKAIDMIKFLAMYFSCVVTYDEYSNTIYLNELKNFRKEDASDWSDYFVGASTDYKTGVAKLNYIQGKEGPEDDLEAYNAQSNVYYGGGTIETDFDAKEEKTIYDLPFSGSWDSPNLTALNFFMPFIKFYEIQYGQSVAYSAVTTPYDNHSQFTSTFSNQIESGKHFFLVTSTSGYYSGLSHCIGSGGLSNPILTIPFLASDTGTIQMCTLTPVSGPNRMLICYPGRTISESNGPSSFITYNSNMVVLATSTTGAVAWFDKPKIFRPIPATINAIDESLAIDSNKTKSITIAERYYGPIKKVFNNPRIDAEFVLPLAVFQNFDFGSYIKIKTKDLTGYFLVQKIENYRDALTPIKVELLYAD